MIPVDSIVNAPSAELRPGQKDSDSLPEYELLDQVLAMYIEHARGRRGSVWLTVSMKPPSTRLCDWSMKRAEMEASSIPTWAKGDGIGVRT